MHYSSGPRVIPHPLPEVNFLIVEIPTPKPYIFMIRVTRQNKCLIAQAPGVIPHPLPQVNFIMVEIPTPKPYIFMIWMNRQIKCPNNLFFVLWNLMISWIVFILHRKIFPIHHTYIYSLVSYLFIKQDQKILTCNSAVASLMLSRFFFLSWILYI